jgi:hypothetical protein
MRRSPLRRGKPLRRTAFKRRSNQTAEWRNARGVVLKRCEERCEARTAVCIGNVAHVHHLLRRSQGGGNEPENLLGVCFHCHEWIHANPKEASRLGLLRLRKMG